EHLHPESARGLNGSRDRVGDVVELQIEPDLCAGGRNRAHDSRAFGCVKLEPDFEKRDLAPELLNQLERFLLCGDVERHNDFVSCCHRNIGLRPVRPTGIFSAATQSAGYKRAGRTDRKSMFHWVRLMSSEVETS